MNLFKRISRKMLQIFRRIILKDQYLVDVHKWFKMKGDESLRLNYELDSNSVVFDLGGYRGDFSASIASIYNCKIHFFEPVPTFFKLAEKNLTNYKSIVLNNFGLGVRNEAIPISIDENSSSVIKKSKEHIEIDIKDFEGYLALNDISKIDLIKINIEGAEFELLEYMLDKNLHLICENIQVQFHDFFDDALSRKNKIRERLMKTHHLTYDFYFVWENWKRN